MLRELDDDRRRKRRKGSGDLRPEEKRRERAEDSCSDVEAKSEMVDREGVRLRDEEASTLLLLMLLLLP